MIKSAILLNIDYAEYDAKRAEFVKCQTDYKSLVDQFPNVSKTVKEKLSILVSLAELPRPRTLVNDYYNRLCNGEHPDFLNSFTTGYSDEVQKLFLKHYNLIEQKKQHKIKLGKIREELNILMKEILRLQAEERKREEEENEAFRQRCFDILCIILILIFLYILYMRFSILQNPFSDFVLYYKAFCTYYLELFYYYWGNFCNSVYDYFSVSELKNSVSKPVWFDTLYRFFQQKNPFKVTTKAYNEYSFYLIKKSHLFYLDSGSKNNIKLQ